MSVHFIKALKRSLLAAVFVAIVVVFQIQANAQVVQQPLIAVQLAQTQPVQNPVLAVDSVGMTVSDMDRAIEFYSTVLSFQKVSDVEVLGTEYEQLQGLFGVRLRLCECSWVKS